MSGNHYARPWHGIPRDEIFWQPLVQSCLCDGCGVGNCASSLVQGVYYYQNAKETEDIPGLMHVNLGAYHISDVNFVAAIDIDKNKVGKDGTDDADRVILAHVSPGHPQTNGKIERYHRTIKGEINQVSHEMPGELKEAIRGFIEYYNYRRYHEGRQCHPL